MKFTKKHLEAIELFAQGKKGTEVSDEIDVIPGTLSRWKQDPEFVQAIYLRAKDLLKDALPEIYKALVVKATAGSYPHARLILDHLDNLEKNALQSTEQSLTFTWSGVDE